MHSRTAKEQFKLMFMVTCWLSLSLYFLFLLCLFVPYKDLKAKGKSCNCCVKKHLRHCEATGTLRCL